MNYDLSKIRIKCAEIVGSEDAHWECQKCEETHAVDRCLLPVIWKEVPNYPESADAALELVEWMSKPENGGRSFYCDRLNDRSWNMSFCGLKKQGNALADTLPLAICLAFLKANNIEPETL